jgi:hypothetical protein
MFFFFNSSQWSETNEERTFQPLVWTEFILHGSDTLKDSCPGNETASH